MTMNENVYKMRAQILNLRSAGIACATAIHDFPPCARPEAISWGVQKAGPDCRSLRGDE